MGGGLESCCVGRVYGVDGARHHPHRNIGLDVCFNYFIFLVLPILFIYILIVNMGLFILVFILVP